ncbi:FAD/NAD(P)-binding domain-containing protein [Trichoderma austrokoningii]
MAENITHSQFACIGTGFYYRSACNVPSLLYSFSFAPNPKWTKILPSHQEMSFNCRVEKCEWIEHTGRWRMAVRNTTSGTLAMLECQFLFSGSGILVYPRKPDLPNIESFDGPVFHAAQWRHAVDLTNKNVAIIGNGCSASQIVPSIKDQAKHVTQFARSKHCIIPPVQVPNLKLFQWMFMHVPGFLRLSRFIFFLIIETEMRVFYMTKAAAAIRLTSTAETVRYIKEKAPQKYHDKLMPDFEIGCKRRIYDPNYLTSLHSENVTLRDDAIEKVTPTGIRSKDGHTDVGIIVFATGYETNSFCTNINIVGRQGATAEEHWKALGGPGAYNTTSISGFPNLFLILGPNSATGHTSTIMAVENSINFALRLIKPRYIDQIQAHLQQTVWLSGGCSNWYNRAQDGSIYNGSSYPYSHMADIFGDEWLVRYSVLTAASLSGLSLVMSGTKSGKGKQKHKILLEIESSAAIYHKM